MDTERRTCPRQHCGRETVFRSPVKGPRAFWSAHIHDISSTGIGLVVVQPFAFHGELSVILPGMGFIRTARAMVAHATPHAGHWLLGCQFSEPLPDEELELILRDSAAVDE
jgi:hypothetical protein